MIAVNLATEDDVARISGGRQFGAEWFGYSARNNRLVVGLGGLVFDGQDWLGFIDISPKHRGLFLFKYARRILDEARAANIDRVLAVCDPDVPRSDVFLRRLGFEKTDEVREGGEVWQWQQS